MTNEVSSTQLINPSHAQHPLMKSFLGAVHREAETLHGKVFIRPARFRLVCSWYGLDKRQAREFSFWLRDRGILRLGRRAIFIEEEEA